MYTKKSDVEIIPLGEDEGTVLFDSESGNTIVLDNIGVDILECFETEDDVDKVIDKLAIIYDADKSEIQADVLEFIGSLVAQGLLITKNHGDI